MVGNQGKRVTRGRGSYGRGLQEGAVRGGGN